LGFEIDIPEKVLADEAQELAEAGESDAALEILEYLIDIYPSSLNGYWRLANLYIGLGERDKAIQHLHKCLEIMPGMPPALHWLERLEAEE
jgi:tetratricopeptide (TPR) repeat protein